MKKNNQQSQKWNKICNMRTTLLHLQYLCCMINQNIKQQQHHAQLLHKDRIIQLYQLCKQKNEIATNNYKLLMIAKLQSLIAVYAPIDQELWNKIDKFFNCVRYLEEQMSREVSRVYVGNGAMFDIKKCQLIMKQIESKIVSYVEQNKGNINKYNQAIKQIKLIEILWQKYLQQINQNVKNNIQPYYQRYVRKRLAQRSKQLQNNIKILQNFIKS